MTTLRELFSRALITLGTTLGLLVIAVFFDVALEMSHAAWEYAVALGVAVGLAVAALAGIHAAMAASLGRTAMGWWGMVAGRVPPGFGPGDGNLARGVGDLLALGLALPAGVALARAGAREGNHGWATGGMLLCGAGIAFGLLAAIPRLYFVRDRGPVRGPTAAPRGDGGRRARKRRARGGAGDAPAGSRDRAGDVAVLATAGMLGIALAMCTSSTLARWQEDEPRRTLARGDWADGCVAAAAGAGCPTGVTLALVPRRDAPLRVQTITTCAMTVATTDGRPVRAADPDALRRAATCPARDIEQRELRLEADPGARYALTLAPLPDVARCNFSVRYLEVAP